MSTSNQMTNWTDWFELEPRMAIPIEVQKQFGIYRIRVVDADGHPLKLGRMFEDDESGVVYIGRSGICEERKRTVGSRLKEWIRRGHSGAETYARAKAISPDKFLKHSLQVSVLHLPVSEICDREAKEIDAYRKRFGESPPFNSNIPGKEKSL